MRDAKTLQKRLDINNSGFTCRTLLLVLYRFLLHVDEVEISSSEGESERSRLEENA